MYFDIKIRIFSKMELIIVDYDSIIMINEVRKQ